MKSEVDADYPTVLMFKPGADQMYSVNHATALVGYFKSYDCQMWTCKNYVRVVDSYAYCIITVY